MATQHFYAHGKLLITGEYTVLKGAKALAFPTSFGQKLQVEKIESDSWEWQSFTQEGKLWFACTFSRDLDIVETDNHTAAVFLQNLLKNARTKSAVNHVHQGLKFSTYLEFPNNWGLGSSSTLISLLAQFFEIDALQLFFESTKGSGYDVACAQASTPIFYTLKEHQTVEINPVKLPEIFANAWFIHLNQKQKSLPEVTRFLANETDAETIQEITALSDKILLAKTEKALIALLKEHEQLTAKAIGLKTIQSQLFYDFDGVVKSLGAWGGDFILALGNDVPAYFKAKNYHTIITFQEMILHNL